ncbi:MAG: hypothetical protein QY322_00195 [bacterium]|nr:MAG: hypothetical protein QY322_00195 [bacterium]
MFKKICWMALIKAVILLALITSPVVAESLHTRGPNFNASFNPQGNAQVGYDVNIHIKVDSTNPGATRINVSCGGVTKGETSEVEFDSSWRTGDCPVGNANINICTKASDDPNWQEQNCVDFGYQLTAPPAPQNPSCSIDTFDAWPRNVIVGEQIQISGSGSCNVQVRAMKVKVNGVDLYEIGAPSLSWTWNTSGFPTGNHKLSLWVAGQGDNNWDYAGKSGSIIVSVLAPNQQPAEPSFPFVTSSIIDINGNLFVIVIKNGSMERRLIPNPDTLDALGIPRSWIDNKGWSNSDLKSIHHGSDIPDVNRDYNGFIDFKNRYFPNTTPIVPNQGSTTVPSIVGQVQVIPNGPQGLASDGECPASPAVLTVGGNAQIARKDLNLRPRPNVNTDPLTIMPNYSEVKVVDGPKCKQEVRWFIVEYKGVQGWAAEVGTGGEYHMYPIVAVQPVATVISQAEATLIVTVPIVPDPATSEVSPLVDTGCDELATGQWWNPFNPPDVGAMEQCTNYVARVNAEVEKCWGKSFPNGGLWDDWANDPDKSGTCGWTVTNDFSTAKQGDIVTWNPASQNGGTSCESANFNAGHVAIFQGLNEDGSIRVTESNWVRNHNNVHVNPDCMNIIHMPAVTIETPVPSTSITTPQVDKCSQYSWPMSWFCKWGWIK